ncbi:amino acid-binding protein [Glaciimonas sp. PCH181]|nr:amino acid-binding protein [Glaciimonas sp. PCH181]
MISARKYLHLNLLLILIFCVTLAPSFAAKIAGENILVGQAIDLSGPNADLGRDYVAGIKTYFDALNANGGINGRHIQYLTIDDQGQPASAVKAVTELIEKRHVDYLFGGVGDEVTQATLTAPVFQRSGLLLYAPLAGADYPQDASILLWRPSYRQEMRYIFSHFGKLGIKDIGLVYQPSPTNIEAYHSLMAEIKSTGIKLSGTVNLTSQNASNIKAIANLGAAKPSFVMVIADTVSTGMFLKKFRTYAPHTFVAGSSLTNLPMLRQLAGAQAVEWTVFSQVVPNPNRGSSQIQLEHLDMMKKYRDEPVSSFTLEGYFAAKSWVQLIRARNGAGIALHDFKLPKGGVDVGGYIIGATPTSNHLSEYVDIALFNKANGLTF